jgi:hypothetical protein
MTLKNQEDLIEIVRWFNLHTLAYSAWLCGWKAYLNQFNFSASQEVELLSQGFIPESLRHYGWDGVFTDYRLAHLRASARADVTKFIPIECRHLIEETPNEKKPV